jgi:transcriptional antiterminator RfaH
MNEFSNHPISCTAWRCVRTQPKREHIAAAQLARLEAVEVFAPRIRFKRRTPRGKVWFEESLFPGYIFSRFSEQAQRAVATAVGVRGLVKFAGECAKVPDFVVETLREETPQVGPILIEDSREMKEGDETIVVEGAMNGLRAVVTKVMAGGERVKVLMDMMGTAVEAEVPVDTLEKVA